MGQISASAEMSKYRNIKCTHDGLSFDSHRERDLYLQYKLLERSGQITHLELKPVYKIVVNGVKIGRYTPDFQFRELDGRLRVIDVKSVITAKSEAFNLRKRLIEALYPGVKVEVLK